MSHAERAHAAAGTETLSSASSAGSSSTAAERSEIRRTAGAAAGAVRGVKPKVWKRLMSPSDALKALACGHAGHALL